MGVGELVGVRGGVGSGEWRKTRFLSFLHSFVFFGCDVISLFTHTRRQITT